ncbi:NAD-dependent epimerase/dehydratase family protein [Tundrisphaera sp. TA3]|uniref:NAD-dependent epimerase/dehydratase family protein n=1 Tax=Tundrisphaera sp. TA3 TaxID=3435775 RepID=UPI003EC0A866
MGDRDGAVIVTGASGRLGGALATSLDDRYRVVAFDRAGPPVPPPGIETIDADLSSDEGLLPALRRFRDRHGPEVASVLHFAAYYDFSGEPTPLYEQVNVAGSARLMRCLREADFQVGQFIYASTMVVHASGEPGRPIDEDSPLGPSLPYSRSKLRAEEALRAGRGDIPLVILRLANVYDDRVHHPVLAQQFRRIREGGVANRFFPGDPGRGQSYLHVSDLIDAVGRAVDRRRDLPPELILLLGEPGAVAYGEIQSELGRLLRGSPQGTRRIPRILARAGMIAQGLLPGGGDPFLRPWMIDRADDHFELDVSRARSALGWSPQQSIRSKLPTMAASLVADPEGWYRDNGLEPPASGQRP